MSTIAVNQITDMTGVSAPVFPPGSAQLNPMAAREDKIINGDFNIWQRGTSSTIVGYAAADRWRQTYVGGTVTQARVSFSISEFGGLSPFYLRQTVSGQTAASQFAAVEQRIESVRSYAGQTITILGYARRNTGNGNMSVEAAQNFGTDIGTGLSPTPGVSTGGTVVSLTGSWAPFAVTLSIPNITSAILGTNNNDSLIIRFWTSAGLDQATPSGSLGLQTIAVDLWGIHIRHGTWTAAATADYRLRDPGTELALCQRYYWRGLPATALNFNAYAAAAYMTWPVMFPVTLRTATPVLTSSFVGSTLGSLTGPTWNNANANGGRFIVSSTVASLNANISFGANDFMAADAEL